MDNQEVTLVKEAAHKMADFLATKNIHVKHNVMLEALSKGFDAANWRTLRAKLDAPVKSPMVEAPQDSTKKVWLFTVPDTKFNTEFEIAGSTLLQAVVTFEAHMLSMGVADPSELLDVRLINHPHSYLDKAQSLLHTVQMVDYHDALYIVLRYAHKGLGHPPSRGIAEAEAYDAAQRPLSVLEDILLDFKRVGMSDYAVNLRGYQEEFNPDEEFVFDIDCEDGTIESSTGTEVLERVYALAMRHVGDLDSMAENIQVAFMKIQEMLTTLHDVTDYAFWNKYQDGYPGVEMD